MHPKWLPRLSCPADGAPLALQAQESASNGCVIRGELRCGCERRYAIERSVPRFAPSERYAESFGVEWTRWSRAQFESENRGRPMAGHTEHMWRVCTGLAGDLRSDEETKREVVAELGCGPGRFLDVARRAGHEVCGVELSRAADVARANFAADPDVLIVQADLLQAPLRAESFDGAWSIGVLHHTPDPALGAGALARCVRPGGWAACGVYPRGGFYDFAALRRWRALLAPLPDPARYAAALAYARVAAYLIAPLLARARRLPRASRAIAALERSWLPMLHLADPRWRVLDLFDALTPAIATTHTASEVAGWLERAGLREIRPTAWCATSFVGRKA